MGATVLCLFCILIILLFTPFRYGTIVKIFLCFNLDAKIRNHKKLVDRIDK